MFFNENGQMNLYRCSNKTKKLKLYTKLPTFFGLGLLAKTSLIFHSTFFVEYSAYKASKLFFMSFLCVIWPRLFKPLYENAERVVEDMSLLEDGQNISLKFIDGKS